MPCAEPCHGVLMCALAKGLGFNCCRTHKGVFVSDAVQPCSTAWQAMRTPWQIQLHIVRTHIILTLIATSIIMTCSRNQPPLFPESFCTTIIAGL